MAHQRLKAFLYGVVVLNNFLGVSLPVLAHHIHFGMPHRTKHHQLSPAPTAWGH